MKKLNNTSLREVLEKLPTPQLDAMLRAELEKEQQDEHAVRLILKVLREREADYPVETNEQIDRAWAEYQHKTAPQKAGTGVRILRAASVVLVVGMLLLALPQEASAGSFFDRFAAWTDGIFELFSPSDSGKVQKEYVFKTEHPGLQELYNTVTDLGVTVPVVPMWLEEGYVLVDCKVIETSVSKKVSATLSREDKQAVFEINIFSHNVETEYHKDQPDAKQHESNGVVHNIFQNDDAWIVVWTRGNIECSMAMDCREDVLGKIIDSIYTMEE